MRHGAPTAFTLSRSSGHWVPGSSEGDTMGTPETPAASTATPSVFHRADGRTKQAGENHPVSGVARSPGSVPCDKAAAITWPAISPALTVLLALLGPVLAPLPLFLRTLVVTAVLVPILVYLVVPGTQRLFAGWLSPR
jgi:antibiotic biosynthesis monooxygenase (ABM) superfamily enzyme